MADPVVPNYISGIGRLATDRFTYEKHIVGEDDRHKANQIDLFPTVVIGSEQSTVQDAIEAISLVIGTPPADASTTVKGIVKLAGDIAGTATSVTVTKIQGKPISTLTPSIGDVLTWDGSVWKPQSISGTFTNLTVTGNTTLGTNSSNTLVVNAQATLSNNLTVNGNTVLGNSGADSTTITGTVGITGNATITGNETVSGILNVGSAIFMATGATACSYSGSVSATLTSGDSVRVIAPNTLLLQSSTMTVTATNTLLSGFVKQNTGTFGVGSGSSFVIFNGASTSIQAPFLLSGRGKINKKYTTAGNADTTVYPALYDVYITSGSFTADRSYIIDETSYDATILGYEFEVINRSGFIIYIFSPSPALISLVANNKAGTFYRSASGWALKYIVSI
jgi:hypothetical protein